MRRGFRQKPSRTLPEGSLRLPFEPINKKKLFKYSRSDAAGKPCGKSHIPKSHKCTKSVKSNQTTIKPTAKAAGIALTAGILIGGASALTRKKPISLADWRKSPKNPRNKPKLSKEEADRIAKEAIATNDQLDFSRAGCSPKKLKSRTQNRF